MVLLGRCINRAILQTHIMAHEIEPSDLAASSKSHNSLYCVCITSSMSTKKQLANNSKVGINSKPLGAPQVTPIKEEASRSKESPL